MAADNPTICLSCGCRDQALFAQHKTRRPSRCLPCAAKLQREYRKTRKKEYWVDKDKRYALKKRYGLSLEDYNRMAEAQRWLCAICELDPRTMAAWPPHHRVLHVDHDHSTGIVRQLLCNHCNRAVGFLRDDPLLAENVASYIRAHQT